MVDAAHEGVTAARANRRSLPASASERRHLDEPGPVQQQLPGRLVQRTPLRPGRAPAPPTLRRRAPARRRRRAARRGASVRRHCARSGEQGVQRQAVDHPAQHDAPERSLRPAGQVLGRLGDGDGASRVRARAAPPRHAARPRAPPRPGRSTRRGGHPRRSRRGRGRPPGVRATRCAATGPAQGPSARAGTSQAAPSTGRSCAASRASSVATRADRKRKASTTWPIASASSFGAPSARRRRPGPRRGATGRGGPAARRRRGSGPRAHPTAPRRPDGTGRSGHRDG